MTKHAIERDGYTLTPGSSVSPYDDTRFVGTITVTKRPTDGDLGETSKHTSGVRGFHNRTDALNSAIKSLTYDEFVKKYIDNHIAKYDEIRAMEVE